MDTETPASDSALSELNSEEVESVGVAQRSRSRSHSIMSASSDLSSTAASPRTLGVPPAKRRKTGAATYDPATPLSEATGPPPRSPTGSISSDTSGSVPNSPSFAHLGTTHPLFVAHAAASANPENPDSADYMQVTRCLWEDCTQPDQGNMDNLVQHIKSVHVVPRQKKYFCQWQGCTRKGQPHTSAYALNAHMRSHTKEKPFFCTLPECDRSFTRSDALAKHMRTVHETEALRPSDPVPRGHAGTISSGKEAGSSGIKRIKLIMGGAGTAAGATSGSTASGATATATTTTTTTTTAAAAAAAAVATPATPANGQKRSSVIGDLPPLPTRQTVQHLGLDIDVHMRDVTDANEESPPLPDELVDAVDMDLVPFQLPTTAEYWPGAVWEDMDEYERGLPPSQYFELLRRQIYWAQGEGRRLTEELSHLRSTAEDVHGNQLTRSSGSGSSDEKTSDANRAFEWHQTELLLDALLAAGVNKTKEAVVGPAPAHDTSNKNDNNNNNTHNSNSNSNNGDPPVADTGTGASTGAVADENHDDHHHVDGGGGGGGGGGHDDGDDDNDDDIKMKNDINTDVDVDIDINIDNDDDDDYYHNKKNHYSSHNHNHHSDLNNPWSEVARLDGLVKASLLKASSNNNKSQDNDNNDNNEKEKDKDKENENENENVNVNENQKQSEDT